MSCAIFTVIGFLAAILNKSNRWIVVAMIVGAIVCLFIACFLAWRDEHKKLLIEEKKNEGSRVEGQIIAAVVDLKRRLDEWSFVPLEKGCNVTLLISATNMNPALAYLDRYATTLSLRLNGKEIEGKYEMLPSGQIEFIADVTEIQNGNIFDFFSAIFQQFPMQDGVPHMGWLRFNFDKLDQAFLEGKTELPAFANLTFRDSRGKVHPIQGDIKLQLNKVRHRSEINKS